MMKLLYVAFICFCFIETAVNAFMLSNAAFFRSSCRAFERKTPIVQTTSSDRRMGELTSAEQTVYNFMDALHQSGLKFRVVVIGKGAILETTHSLGPKLKLAQSPSTGENLLTLASEDQSFELHITLSEVSKVVLVTKGTPRRIMRLVRLLNAEGQSMLSIILADDSDDAISWYQSLIEKYGGDIQL
jgi:hypothetical protein